jgi:cardiolipin synthase
MRLQGPVVNWLQTVFLEDWAYALDYNRRNEPSDFENILPELPEGKQVVQIMASGPDSSMEAIHRVHVAAIHAAAKRLWLTTPYFVPTEASMLALTNAALRGGCLSAGARNPIRGW